MTDTSHTTNLCSGNGLTRRALLHKGAAASALVPLAAVPALAATGGDAELALPAIAEAAQADRLIPLLHRYHQAVEAFNAADHPTDAAFDAYYDSTVVPAELALVGVPAATKADALAAFDLITDEFTDAAGDFGAIMNSLTAAVRGYIERGRP